LTRHHEAHRNDRTAWLRAAVLGADDGLVSIASLMIGVAAASASNETILVAGVAGLVAGAMSMAVGEYVSVSSQRDSEKADIERETRELESHPQAELDELAMVYVERGIEKELAMKVAQQLSERDRLGAHMRDELGVDPDFLLARPMQAAWISAASFASFAVIPIAALLVAPDSSRIPRDRRSVPHEPSCSRRLWRSSRWRAARSCRVTGHPRRGSGDGGDRGHRETSRRLRGGLTTMKHLLLGQAAGRSRGSNEPLVLS